MSAPSTNPRDRFDAALIPGMRDRLAKGYAQFRLAELAAIEKLAPAPGGIAEAYHLRDCPGCAAPAPAETVLQAHGIDLVKCPACRLTFTRQVMDRTVDASRYQTSTLDVEAMRLRCSGPYLELETSRSHYYAAFLGSQCSTPGRLLEIGCGTGTFLLAARDAGWQAFGVEPGLAAAAVASERGCDVVRGYFPDDVPGDRSPFDAIAILDVLEHFDDPIAFLRLIGKHLTKDGRLFIQVPNWDSLLVQLEGASSSVVCPGHWTYFTPESLTDILARAGYRSLAIETVVTERDRMAAFTEEQRRTAMASLRPNSSIPRAEADGLPSADTIHELKLGYKLIGVFSVV